METDPYPHGLHVLILNLREAYRVIFGLFYIRVYLVGLFKTNQFWTLLRFVKFLMHPKTIKAQSQKWLSSRTGQDGQQNGTHP
jgi:hypothetical protein